MVLPEIDHNFLKLTLGINGTQDPIRRDLRHKLTRRLQVIFAINLLQLLLSFTPFLVSHLIRILRRSVLIGVSLIISLRLFISLGLFAALKLLEQRSRVWVFRKQLGGRHVKYFQAFDLRLSNRIVNR